MSSSPLTPPTKLTYYSQLRPLSEPTLFGMETRALPLKTIAGSGVRVYIYPTQFLSVKIWFFVAAIRVNSLPG